MPLVTKAFSTPQMLDGRQRPEQDFKRERGCVENVRHGPPRQFLLQQQHSSRTQDKP